MTLVGTCPECRMALMIGEAERYGGLCFVCAGKAMTDERGPDDDGLSDAVAALAGALEGDGEDFDLVEDDG